MNALSRFLKVLLNTLFFGLGLRLLFSDAQAQIQGSKVNNCFATDFNLDSLSASDGYPHILIFCDGRQLRGEFVSIDDTNVIWRRLDASEPILIARGAVAWISFGKDVTRENGKISLPDGIQPDAHGIISARATIRPPGCEPIEGDVSSADGSVFWLKVSSPAHRHLKSGTGDLLVFKDGDELQGSILHAAPNAPFGWKSEDGQELEFAPDNIAGVRFMPAQKQEIDQKEGDLVELRDGDRYVGILESMDDKAVHLRVKDIGSVAISKDDIRTLRLAGVHRRSDGADDPDVWMEGFSIKPDAAPRPNRDWIYLDGRYILRTRGPDIEKNPTEAALSTLIKPQFEHFEVSFDVASTADHPPEFTFFFGNEEGLATVDLECGPNGGVAEQTLHQMSKNKLPGRNLVHRESKFTLPAAIFSHRRLSVDTIVDYNAKTIDVYLDGTLAATCHVAPRIMDRAPENFGIVAKTHTGSPAMISDVCIEPWYGDTSGQGANAPLILFRNGDSAEGAIMTLRDGVLVFDVQGRSLEIPTSSVEAIRFPAKPTHPSGAVARIRLRDGGIIHAEGFQLDENSLSIRSSRLGDLKIPRNVVSELVLDPTPLRIPDTLPRNYVRPSSVKSPLIEEN